MAKKPTAKDLLFLLDDRLAVNLKPGEGVEKAKQRLEKRLREGEEDLASLKRAISIYDALLSLGVASKEALAASLLEHAKKRQAKGEMDSAYEALELASRFGGAREKIAFAKTLISGTFGVSSREEGLSILSELADSGCPEASYLIYLLHQTSPDLVEGKLAKEEYLRARALGYPLALEPLGEGFDERPYTAILLERFQKGEESLAFALSKRKDLGEETRRKYLLLALKQENAEAEEAYAEMVKEEKKEEGRRYFELAGNHGKPECYLKAASLLEASPHFYQGEEGEKQKEELRLYRLAQEANVPEALTKIGIATLFGYGLEKEPKVGLALLRLALAKGERYEAPYWLGECLYRGLGAKKNPERAIDYWKIAAKEGNALALDALAAIYESGAKGVKKNPRLAAKYSFASGKNRD